MIGKLFTKNILILSVINSLFLVLVLYFIVWHYGIDIGYFTVITIILSFFIIVYIINMLLLNNYIEKKIKQIFLSIFKIKQNDYTRDKYGVNSIKEIEKEIENWSDKRSNELIKLRENDEYRKEFIGNISHELKTPIFIAQSYIETLLDGSLYDEKVNKKHLKKALKSILRLSQIVKDLEMISRLEKDTLTLDKEIFDINTLLIDIVDSLELSAKEENIDIKIKIDEDKKCYVFADEEKIEQVLINLLINAIKYNEKNGFVKIYCKDIPGKIQINIEDNGIGIEDHKVNRIFERFYRIDKDRSRKKGGTGLGLSIVKHIIDAHGQSIEVKSEYGRGSVFSFTLEKAQ